jgi:DNA-binding protein H-NS
MKDNQLDKMSVKDLRELKVRIDAAIVARQAKEKAELRQKMAELAEEAGLTLEDVLGGRRGGKGKGSVAVKYRHPDNATLTWTGRGRRPKWLEGVANIEKFRV